MLIATADLDGACVDLRIDGGRISAIAPHLAPSSHEVVFDARGGMVLPGLHDHHIHLFGLAAALASVRCGPPEVANTPDLVARLAAAGGEGWLRGIGYHESVAGDIDRFWLDRCGPARPIRIQHRSGRLWIFNSRALQALAEFDPDLAPLERVAGRLSGRLYDGDGWLRSGLRAAPPDLHFVSAHLAKHGITGVTDASYTNDAAAFAALFAATSGDLAQNLKIMGDLSLSSIANKPGCEVGAYKVHLHDGDYPDPDVCISAIAAAHEAGRGAAFHCVTEADLAFALSCIEAAGASGADRIEHAALAAPDHVRWLADLGVRVVTQPHFIAERGDWYRSEIPASDHDCLYRARAFLEAGVPLAFGSDAPYGGVDPWVAMQAAVMRATPSGAVIGADECLSPEQALRAYLSPLDDPGGEPQRIAIGAPAYLCVLDRPWREARENLASVGVVLTLKNGAPTHGSTASINPHACAVAAEIRRPESAK